MRERDLAGPTGSSPVTFVTESWMAVLELREVAGAGALSSARKRALCIGPGAIAFTCTPELANSTARLRVRDCAAFVET